jgi:hypothetical protein
MKEEPQTLEYARPPESSARDLKQRRARRVLLYFLAVVLVGTLLRMAAALWSDAVASIANLVIIIGSVGTAWWASVLFDLGGSGRAR